MSTAIAEPKLPWLRCISDRRGVYIGRRVTGSPTGLDPKSPALCLAATADGVVPTMESRGGSVIIPHDDAVAVDCHCLVGVLPLTAASYALVLTEATKVADLPGGGAAFMVERVQALPIGRPGSAELPGPALSAAQKDDEVLLGMALAVYNSRTFYLAIGYNLTLTAQRIAVATTPALESMSRTGAITLPAPGAAAAAAATAADHRMTLAREPGASPFVGSGRSLRFLPGMALRPTPACPFGVSDLSQSDPRFFWNRWMLHDSCPLLTVRGIEQFATPIIQGLVTSSGRTDMPRSSSTTSTGAARWVELLLISRRSCRHVGTRFYTRGLDESGNPANFAETEQIIVRGDGAVASFVQVRGSIPLVWDQRPSLKWDPVVTMAKPDDSYARFRSHAHELLRAHEGGPVLGISLVDKKGDQLMLGSAYEDVVRRFGEDGDAMGLGSSPSNTWSLIWFDFHAECKSTWANLSKLLHETADRSTALSSSASSSSSSAAAAAAATPSSPLGGTAASPSAATSAAASAAGSSAGTVGPTPDLGLFFACSPEEGAGGGLVLCVQKGVVRTNCMDNLDRTNVVQSLFARRAALAALSERPWDPRPDDPVRLWELTLPAPTSASSSGSGGVGRAVSAPPGDKRHGGVSSVPEPAAGVLSSPFVLFERQFMRMWADNADAMSILYSGTGALKTDFTRTGKRTLQGMVNDGINSVTRWVIGNFEDGRRQDAWDLVSGAYRVNKARPGDGGDAMAASAAAASSSSAAAHADDGSAGESSGAGGKGSDAGSAPSTQSALQAYLESWSPFGAFFRVALLLAGVAALAAAAISMAEVHLGWIPVGDAAGSDAVLATTGLLGRALGSSTWSTRALLGGAAIAMASAAVVSFVFVKSGSALGYRIAVAPHFRPLRPKEGLRRADWLKLDATRKRSGTGDLDASHATASTAAASASAGTRRRPTGGKASSDL